MITKLVSVVLKFKKQLNFVSNSLWPPAYTTLQVWTVLLREACLIHLSQALANSHYLRRTTLSRDTERGALSRITCPEVRATLQWAPTCDHLLLACDGARGALYAFFPASKRTRSHSTLAQVLGNTKTSVIGEGTSTKQNS